MPVPADFGEPFKIRPACPPSEYSEDFLRGMVNRMSVSFHKYGFVQDSGKIDALESAKVRMAKYLDTGNTEFLIDAANFCMIEFMRPSHLAAFFRATDSDEAPGRVLTNGQVVVEAVRNEDL